MKLSNQTKYFINGVILLSLACFSVTLLPLIIKTTPISAIIKNYIYYEIEFFLLSASAIFYLFSPKYYKYQILSILVFMFIYNHFVKF